MSGKQYFGDCCRKMGMDSAALFKIGEQNAQCYGGYVYHCPTRLRGPSHRFVVNYIEERGLYVAWSLDTPGSEKKTVFRVLKKNWSICRRARCTPFSKRRIAATGRKRRCTCSIRRR
ncbi:MAG: hypothetical protein ACLR4A_10290 [Christensenellales bacterium]